MKTRMLRAYKHFGHPVALLFVYLLLAGIILYTIDYYSKDAIEKLLIKAVPWALTANMALIFIGIIVCRGEIAGFFSKMFYITIPPNPPLLRGGKGGLLSFVSQKINYQGVLLLLVIIFAFVMTSFVAPRTHRIYFDEDIYANAGQNIALSGQAATCNYGEFVHGEYKPDWLSYNKEPSGWPYLISLAFQIFGTNELYAFLLNNLLLAAGVGLVFVITTEITGIFFPSILAAFIFSLIPHNLIWANTAAAEPAAAFFTLASVLCLIIYLKTNEWRHLYLLAVVLPFSSQMRPESILIIPLSFLALAFIRPENMLRRQLWGAGIITAVFLLPQMLHFYAVSGQSWGADGAKFSLDFFRNNIMVNGLYYLNNEAFPALVTIFSLLGLLCAKYSGRWKLVVFFWFLIFWGIFLFFYAGSYRYGADVRFAVVSFAPLAILAALGMDWVKNKLQPLCFGTNATIIIVLILLLAWIKFLPLIRLVGQEAWAARADHAITREFIKKIPDRSIVVSHIPTMILLWGQSAVSAHGSVNDEGFMRHLVSRYDGGVYFHHNYWCDTSSDANAKVCKDVKQKYDLEEVVSDNSTGRLFGLYRIRIKEAGKK